MYGTRTKTSLASLSVLSSQTCRRPRAVVHGRPWSLWSRRRSPEAVMLGIGKPTAGAEDYYLGVAQGIEDYYVGIASPGRWVASSVRLLSLDGDVEPGPPPYRVRRRSPLLLWSVRRTGPLPRSISRSRPKRPGPRPLTPSRRRKNSSSPPCRPAGRRRWRPDSSARSPTPRPGPCRRVPRATGVDRFDPARPAPRHPIRRFSSPAW